MGGFILREKRRARLSANQPVGFAARPVRSGLGR
jgi:hypothetical protein